MIDDQSHASQTTVWKPYGWVMFHPHTKEPWPTFPVVYYFVERSECGGDWPIERSKSLLSFWLGRDAIPECLQ